MILCFFAWAKASFTAHDRDVYLVARRFDRDGNGYISPDELLHVVCNSGEKLSREEAEELVSMFDTNADGQLSWEEFVEFFKCDRDAAEVSSLPPEETA